VSNVKRQDISQPQRYDTYVLKNEPNHQKADLFQLPT